MSSHNLIAQFLCCMRGALGVFTSREAEYLFFNSMFPRNSFHVRLASADGGLLRGHLNGDIMSSLSMQSQICWLMDFPSGERRSDTKTTFKYIIHQLILFMRCFASNVDPGIRSITLMSPGRGVRGLPISSIWRLWWIASIQVLLIQESGHISCHISGSRSHMGHCDPKCREIPSISWRSSLPVIDGVFICLVMT